MGIIKQHKIAGKNGVGVASWTSWRADRERARQVNADRWDCSAVETMFNGEINNGV